MPKIVPKKLQKGLYWRGDRIWGRVSIDGKKVRKPMVPKGHKIATTRPAVAKELYRKWLKELGQQDDLRDLPELLDEWQAFRASLGYEKQARRNRAILDSFCLLYEIESPNMITKQTLQAWTVQLTAQLQRPKTIKNKLASVTGFCNWMEDHDIIEKVPRIPNPKVEQRIPPHLNPEQYRSVLDTAKDSGCWLEIFIALNTGMRLGELRRLEWPDMHFRQKLIVIPKSKSNRPRSISMTKEFIKEIKPLAKKTGLVFPGRDYDTGKGQTSGFREEHTFIDAIKKVRESLPEVFTEGRTAKETGRAYHLFRHTYAVRAAKSGVPIQAIQAQLGHKDIRTTMIYAIFSPDTYLSQIERMEGDAYSLE